MHADDVQDATWLLIAIVELVRQAPGLEVAEIHEALISKGHGELTIDDVRRARLVVRGLGIDRTLFVERLPDGQQLLLSRPDVTLN